MRIDKAKNFPIGIWLINNGIITQEQLDIALEQQNKSGRGLLGEALVEMGFCSEEDIARAMAARSNVEYVPLNKISYDMTAMATISADAAKRYQALPIAIEHNKLVVAMKNPTDLMIIDDLRVLTGYDIKPVACLDSELQAAIEKYGRTGIDFADDSNPSNEAIMGPGEDTSNRAAVQLANLILSQAVSAKASDIHIEPYENSLRIRFRIDGVLHDIMEPPRRLHAGLVSRIKVMAGMDIANKHIPQDGRITLKIDERPIDIRIASLPVSFGERVTMRLLDRTGTMLTLQDLGVAPMVLEQFRQVITLPYGFILVTGPTGSGKSTTLYASLSELDKVEKNIITIEDPIEYRLDGMSQIQLNSRAGLNFASGLRSILRNDPDVIMVGEIRDKETARIAIESSITGHLVFSTLHTNDASGSISRLIEMEVEPFLIASSLACALAQRLARRLCLQCRIPYEAKAEELEQIEGFPLLPGEKSLRLYKPGKCSYCANTGYRGRIGIYELLRISESLRPLILEKTSAQEIRAQAVREGMITLRQDGLHKVRQGLTSLEEILRIVL
ncbi:GspE/PulE family protein [Heliorestis convoluta]|nr:ATPase, T2SS/T4P/T4SS family [Heliorestis convoluta]